MRRFKMVIALAGVAMIVSAQAGTAKPGFRTNVPPMLTLGPAAPVGSNVKAIISSGDEFGDFEFEGIPDGIGFVDQGSTVDVYVTHEQSRVPFLGSADLEDSSISQLTVNVGGKVLAAEVALPATEGLIRFCSAFMASVAEGFASPVFFANEESNDVLAVPAIPPATALYGPDPFYGTVAGGSPPASPNRRQGGYAVALDVATGAYTVVPGMGRHNHENTVVVPGGWAETVALSGDDTFDAPASQLYMYKAAAPAGLVEDTGHLFAFRVTATDEGPVVAGDPFNGANDYGDIALGDDWEGEFIQVDDLVADGDLTTASPQAGLENWSNDHNVFQFIRVEDIAYDKNQPNVVYFADTGERRARANPTTGRLERVLSPSNFVGPYPNGRIFRMEFSEVDPQVVTSFSILRDNDVSLINTPGEMHQPDNIDTSATSLMVQEDSAQLPNSRIWRYDFATETWSVVASVNHPSWESSGIVDASAAFGPGAWLVTVQAHSILMDQVVVGGVTFKREGGQLLLVRLPGT